MTIRERETRAPTALARSIRLVQRARYDAKVANTAVSRCAGASKPPESGAA